MNPQYVFLADLVLLGCFINEITYTPHLIFTNEKDIVSGTKEVIWPPSWDTLTNNHMSIGNKLKGKKYLFNLQICTKFKKKAVKNIH